MPVTGVHGAGPRPARRLWRRIEPLHAVTYFATECREALDAAGLRGFWMGYFGARAAPMGPVGPGLVIATFYNFHPDMVRRSIPDAWSLASPAEVLDARRASAAAALRRLYPPIDALARRAGQTLAAVVDGADGAGRPLFAANRDLEPPDDAVEALWQHCTSLREHRGDGHVAVLAAEGIDGCEAHLLAAAADGTPDHVLRDNRGWSLEEWHEAAARLTTRGALRDGELTDHGMAMHRHVETRTDELAARPYAMLDDDAALDGLLRDLDVAARAVTHAEVIPFPNPMGLPRAEP
jgi:hypothetical protein